MDKTGSEKGVLTSKIKSYPRCIDHFIVFVCCCCFFFIVLSVTINRYLDGTTKFRHFYDEWMFYGNPYACSLKLH